MACCCRLWASLSLSGEWLFALGNYLEAGVGVGYHMGKTSSFYRDLQNANGSEIEQELKLQPTPGEPSEPDDF